MMLHVTDLKLRAGLHLMKWPRTKSAASLHVLSRCVKTSLIWGAIECSVTMLQPNNVLVYARMLEAVI
jgi:hypothetical protein